LLSFFHSKKEKQVEVLTSATPVDSMRYALIRLAIVALGFFFLCVLVIGISICFYAVFFQYWNYSAFILPAIITILPCFVFFLGVGNLLGRIHPGFLYVLMLVSLAMIFIPMPGALHFSGFFGSSFYASFPLALPVGTDGEPAFSLSTVFLAVRAIYLVMGVVLLVVSMYRIQFFEIKKDGKTWKRNSV
jgi:ABC-2 type transport system permease protein